MDRPIVYVQALGADTDQLNLAKFAMVALAELSQAVFGSGTLIVGLAATPGSGLNVAVGPGAIYQMGAVDSTAFGSLGTNSSQIMKQGILLNGATVSCPAPTSAGQSINYLIEVQQQDADSGSTILQFYNSAAPLEPYAGPNNTGAASNTVRTSKVNIQVKAGAAAATGAQTTPAVDSGFVPAYVVTVPYGATSIASGAIVTAGGAPFLTESLIQKISTTAAQALIAAAIAPLATIVALNAAVAAEAGRAEGAEGALSTAIAGEASRAEGVEATKAPLAAPALTVGGGGAYPTTPTPTVGDATTKIANMAALAAGLTAFARVGNLAGAGPWGTWDPCTGEVHVWGQYRAAISTEGSIAVTFPCNIGTFQAASATIYQNSTTASTVAQIDSATPPTSTGMNVRIQDNQGGSAAAATGFDWEAWGYSAICPTGL